MYLNAVTWLTHGLCIISHLFLFWEVRLTLWLV
jgi:hypothetical protein